MQSQDVAIADERQAVIDCVASGAVGCNIQEKPGVQNQNNHQRAREMRRAAAAGTAEKVLRSVCTHDSDAGGIPQDLPSCCIKIAFYKIIERPHMFFFCKEDMVGNTLKYLNDKKMVKTQRFNVLTVTAASVISLPETFKLTCCEISRQKKVNSQLIQNTSTFRIFPLT